MADPTDRFLDTDMNEIKRRLGQDNEQRVVEVGESVFDRDKEFNGAAVTSGDLSLAGFTARQTQNISQIRVASATTAAGATPTLVRLGVYQRSTDGLSYALVASTVTDLTLFAAANTVYTRSFSAPFLKTAGSDYLVANLVVSGAAMPTLAAPTTTVIGGFSTSFQLVQPFVAGKVAAQADLPASFLASAVVASLGIFHALLLQ